MAVAACAAIARRRARFLSFFCLWRADVAFCVVRVPLLRRFMKEARVESWASASAPVSAPAEEAGAGAGAGEAVVGSSRVS